MATDITTLAVNVTTTQARKSLASFSKSLWRARQVALQLLAVPINLKAKVDAAELEKLDALRKQLNASSAAAEKFGQNWSNTSRTVEAGSAAFDAARTSISKIADSSVAAVPSVARLGGILAGWFSTKRVIAFTQQSILSFAAMENSVYKFRVTFEGISEAARNVADTLTKTYKLSDRSTLGMLADTGNLLQGFGFAKKESLKMAEAVAKLGIDLASFHGYAGGAAGAVRALNSGLVGNTESLRGLGIVVNMESEQFKTLYNQFREGQGMTEAQAKAMAILQTAMIQGKNAIGDYLRPGETLNQLMADNSEAADRFRTSIGAGLEGAAKIAVKTMTGLMNIFNGLSAPTKNLITRTAALAAGFLTYKTAVASVSAAKAVHSRLLGTNTAATIANSAAVSGNTKTRAANTTAVVAGSAAMSANSSALAANAVTAAGAAKGFSLMGAAATAAAGGVKLLSKAIPYVGWALLALDAGMFIFDKITAGSKEASEALEREAAKAREAGDALRQRNEEAVNSFERLRTLAGYEELHADEVKEAQAALESIRNVYPDVGITIDATTGKINIQADAFRNLNEAVRKLNFSQAGKELAAIEKQITDVEGKFSGSARAFFSAAVGRNTNSEEYTTLFGIDSAAKHDRQIRDQLKPLYERRDQLRQTLKGSEKKGAATSSGKASISEANKGYRSAVKEYEKTRWNIDFANAGGTTKVEMMDEKIAEARKQLRGLQQRAAAGAVAPQGEDDYKTQAVKKQTEILELERQRGAILQQNAQIQKTINTELEQFAALSRSPAEQAAALLQKLQTVKAEMADLKEKAASGDLAPVGQRPYEEQYRDKLAEYGRLYSETKQTGKGLSGMKERFAAAQRSISGKKEDPQSRLKDITVRVQEAMKNKDFSGVLSAASDFEKFKNQETRNNTVSQPITERRRWMTNTMVEGIDANSSKARTLEARSFTRPKDDTTSLQKAGNEELKKMTTFLEGVLTQFLRDNSNQFGTLAAKLESV